MSFTSLLRHRVAIARRTDAGAPTYDELGHPVTTLETMATVPCRIQPLNTKEIALLSQAGAVVGDHRIYMVAGTDVNEGDQLVAQPADGRTFEVTKIDDMGGEGRFLELAATLVTSRDVPQS